MRPEFDNTSGQRPAGASRLADQELDAWCERVSAVPDLRIAKVMRVRRAIVANQYDEESMLDRALGVIHNEVGTLCRDEDAADDAW